MLFEQTKRVKYAKCPLKSVICQIRFPSILAITNDLPVAFQETLRETYPDFQQLLEEQNQIVLDKNNEDSTPKPRFIQNKSKNYKFSTADKKYSINLTNTFISLTTSDYTTWEDFKSHFVSPLYSFMQIYKPAYFSRIGLRYIDAFNYEVYGLTDATLNLFFNHAVLGCFSEEKLSEHIRSLQQSFELDLPNGYYARILTTKAHITGEQQPSLIFDSDFISASRCSALNTEVESIMDSLHCEASGFIHWVISDKMEALMEPSDL